MRRTTLAAAAIALSLLTAACAGAEAAPTSPDDPVTSAPGSGMCAPEAPDCDDTAVDDFDVDTAREAAASLLGAAEDDLAADVRIGRRGDEHMMLTEDYVLGRRTVDLDADGNGVHRVVSVVVELPDGPETFSR